MLLKRHWILLLFSIVLSSFSLHAKAAKVINLRHQSLASLQTLSLTSTQEPLLQLKELARELDEGQTLHLHLQQTYASYPIWGADCMLHFPKANSAALKQAWPSLVSAKRPVLINGFIYQGISRELGKVPEVSAEKVFSKVLALKASAKGQVLSDKKMQLQVYVDQNQKAHWVFYLQFKLKPETGMPSKPTYLVDAQNFTVYRSWDNIQTQDRRLEAKAGGFGGNKKMGKVIYDNLASHYPSLAIKRNGELKLCYLMNQDVVVLDASRHNIIAKFPCLAEDATHNHLFWDGALDAVNGAYSPANDALYIGQIIKELYQKWYKLPVLRRGGKPMLLIMRVHEDLENAYWDGEEMTFGDGENFFYPLVSLGVGAHEISHGFTEQHANLFYEGQSGGLNESFSDMAAQAAEFFIRGKSSWQVGSEILKEPNHALRYMDHPALDCKGIEVGEDCSIEQLSSYHPGLNVHLSSGLFNRAFYLMATALGWDTKKAFDVMVQANRFYWTPTVTFLEAACGVMNAAQDLAYSTEVISKAFTEVGIDVRLC